MKNRKALAMAAAGVLLSASLNGCGKISPSTPETESVAAGQSRVAETKAGAEPASEAADVEADTFMYTEAIYDGDDDTDGDGLTDSEETALGTRAVSPDTDGDGLADGDEVNTYGTSPLNADSDGDGLTDGDEIYFGLDPLSSISDGVTADAERKFSETQSLDDGATLGITGKADIASVYMGVMEYGSFDRYPGVAGEVYEFYMENMDFDTATVTLPYSEDTVRQYGGNEEDLAIFQVLNDGTLEKVGGTVDTENNTVTAGLEHFSKYTVALEDIVMQDITPEVYLLIDDSGSMYDPETTGVEDSQGNDIEFKRVDMAEKLIEMTEGSGISYALSTFTANMHEICTGFDDSDAVISEELEGIRTNTDHTFDGTSIAETLYYALRDFSSTDFAHRKFIVLLTDGMESDADYGLARTSDLYADWVMDDAQDRNVSIIVVGLGNEVDADYLIGFAEATGGIYVSASNAGALESVYEAIMAGINSGYADLDGNGENDSILLADSGFSIGTETFAQPNYIYIGKEENYGEGDYSNGQCFGIAMLYQLYHSGSLPVLGEAVSAHRASLLGDYVQAADAYNLFGAFDLTPSNGYFVGKENLADVDMSELQEAKEYADSKTVCTTDASGNTVYDCGSYRYVTEDGTIAYKDEFLAEIKERYPLVGTYLAEYNGDITLDGQTYEIKKIYRMCYNLNGVDRESLDSTERDRYNMLQAIHNLYSWQGSDRVEKISLLGDVLDDEGNTKKLNRIISELQKGHLLVIAAGAHAINCVSIYEDINDPCSFILRVYDNNDPGVLHTIQMKACRYTGLWEHTAINSWTNTYQYKFYDTDNCFMQGAGAEVDCSFYISKLLTE